MTEAVAVRGLICQFGPVRAVDDLSFEVAEGEVFGLGPNGAGKTTVIRVVTTLLKPAPGPCKSSVWTPDDGRRCGSVG
jgi:ABC-2 type transport system ATP-binding protein